MLKKLWAYQHRESSKPWAICAKVIFPRGNPSRKRISFVVYSERINNEHHVMRSDQKHYESAQDAARDLTDLVAVIDPTFHESPADRRQLENFARQAYEKE